MPFDKTYLHLRQTYTRTPLGWNINQVSPAGVKVSARPAKANEVVLIDALHEARKQNRLPGRTEGWRDPDDEVPILSERTAYTDLLVSFPDSRVGEARYTQDGTWICLRTGLQVQVTAWQHKPSWHTFNPHHRP